MADIGFIGLGNLGMPIAASMVRAGNHVVAFDLSAERMGEAKHHGIEAAESLPAAVGEREFVVSLLPMPRDVETVATGPDGILSHIRHDALYIEMSTIDPVSVRRIGAEFCRRGIAMIDSPVTRSVDMAWQGRSALLIGGEDSYVARAMSILRAVSDLQTHCGPLGNGSAMKLANNFMAHGILAVVCETLALGIKAGLTLETVMLATERSGTFNKILLEVLPTRAFRGDFSAGFRAALALKDQRLAIGLAEELGAHAPVGRAVEKLLAELAAGDPNLDLTALLRRQELEDGFEARLGPVLN